MFSRVQQSLVLFWLGICGVVFYVVQPILFPEVPSHPELLPVYSLMMGLGVAGKYNNRKKDQNGSSDE